jgi:protease-4
MVAAIAASVLLSFSAFALPLSGPGFRADDGDLFGAEDNPAKMANPGKVFRFGFAYTPAPDSTSASYDLAAAIPFLGYARMSDAAGVRTYDLGTGLSFDRGRAFSLGYDYAFGALGRSNIGLLLRPASFASIGLTASYAEGREAIYGLGLGFRPLAFMGGSGSALTLTADASYSSAGSFSMESLGLRLALPGLASLRGWYAFEGWNASALASGAGGTTASAAGASIGLELSLALGASDFSARGTGIASDSGAYRFAESLSLDLSSPEGKALDIPSPGEKIFVIDGLDSISALPESEAGLSLARDALREISFPELMARLERARKDKTVRAIAFENLPPLPGLPYYEELRAELASIRSEGKKVYFYADSYGREFAYLAAAADRMALNPLGSLELSGYSFRRLYLKPLFDSIGVSFVNLAPWDTKSAYNSYSQERMPQGERDMMARFYGRLQDELTANLDAGRASSLKRPAAETIAEGPFLTAADALAAGLVDKVAYRDEFEDSLAGDFPKAKLVSSLGAAGEESWGADAFARRVAVVWLSGDIGMGRGLAGRDIGTLAADEIARLRKDGSIAAIVLRVDSPGGAAFTSDLIAREVRLAVAAGKPVVVSMGSYAASGGYYISAPASRIFAEPTTVTGSIGVTGLLPNLSGTLEKLGLHYDGFDLSPGASLADPLKPADSGEAKRLNASIISVYDRFIDVVAEGRKMDREKVKAIGEGRVWTGREALANGLVDELGGLAEAKAYAAKKVGGRVVFEDCLPGDAASFLDGFLPFGASSSAISKALAPIENRLDKVLALGQGPLYYLDTEELGL